MGGSMVEPVTVEPSKADMSYRLREMLEEPRWALADQGLSWQEISEKAASKLSQLGYHFCGTHEVVSYLSKIDMDLAGAVEKELLSLVDLGDKIAKTTPRRALVDWYYHYPIERYALVWLKTEQFSKHWWCGVRLPDSAILIRMVRQSMKLSGLEIGPNGQAVAAYKPQVGWSLRAFRPQDRQPWATILRPVLDKVTDFAPVERSIRQRLELWQSGLVLDCERDRPTELCTRYEPTPERPLVAVEGEFVEAEVVRDGATLFLPVTLALRARIAE